MSEKENSGEELVKKKLAAEVQQRAGAIAHGAAEITQKAAHAAGKGAKIAVDAAVEAGVFAADAANKAGKYISAKSREYLAKEFAKNRPLALETLARLRKAKRSASPTEVIDDFSTEFTLNEKGVSAESAKFLAAATNYVLTLNEIYGKKVRDEGQRQLLLYVLLAANSKVAAVVAQVGVAAFKFLTRRFQAVALVTLVADRIKKYSGKASWLITLAQLGGIPNAGRKSASWIVVTASRKILGNPPKAWPTTPKTSPVKKPATPKKPAVAKRNSKSK